MRYYSWVVIVLVFSLLAACAGGEVYAPVTDISMIEAVPKAGCYQVKEKDTLYSIAWRYGLDYQYLAKINHIASPYQIYSGQLIYLTKGHHPAAIPAIKSSKQPLVREYEPTANVSKWQWPAQGPILQNFGELNRGLNIGGEKGDPIFTTAPGVVVYSGNGLRAYGNLIIIKHNATFLSAYAHNSRVFIQEGQRVHYGQKIAEMGDSGTTKNMLHFEIRRKGKPVNPLSYLGRR